MTLPANATTDASVNRRGQTTLPLELRRRWGLLDGGEIGYIDLGDAALVVPGGLAGAKAELHRVVRAEYEAALAAIDDPDIALQ